MTASIGITRWWSELRNPALKCERIGHNVQTFDTRIYLYPPAHRWAAVADKATERCRKCIRCGHVLETAVVNRSSLQGLTMDSERWDELRAKGRLAQ